jgi:hypothetical protein
MSPRRPAVKVPRVSDLVSLWRARSDEHRKLRNVRGAWATTRCADELEAALRADDAPQDNVELAVARARRKASSDERRRRDVDPR